MAPEGAMKEVGWWPPTAAARAGRTVRGAESCARMTRRRDGSGWEAKSGCRGRSEEAEEEEEEEEERRARRAGSEGVDACSGQEVPVQAKWWVGE